MTRAWIYALLLAAAASPTGGEPAACPLSFAAALASARAETIAVPGARVEVHRDDAAALIAAIDAAPPVTAYAGDALFLVWFGPMARIAIADRGCVRAIVDVDTEGWAAILRQAMGEAL